MPHLDPDRLTLLAVGDHPGDEDEAGHLAGCPECHEELGSLREVAARAREAQLVGELPAPPERVWQRITITLAGPAPADGHGAARRTEHDGPPASGVAPARAWRSGHGGVPGQAGEAGHGATPGRAGRSGHGATPGRRRELARLLVATAAAAVLAVGATLGVSRLLDPADPDPPAVTAQAALERLPAAPAAARGEAQVLGGGTLHLHLTGLAPGDGYHEVWLIDPDTMEMISVGVLDGSSDVLLPLPPTVDLGVYRLVDVSAEPYDGDTSHSGESLLRGQLAPG